MSTKGAASNNRRNKNIKMAADMAKRGEKRTTYRDPILGIMRAIGTYPGTVGGKIKMD